MTQAALFLMLSLVTAEPARGAPVLHDRGRRRADRPRRAAGRAADRQRHPARHRQQRRRRLRRAGADGADGLLPRHEPRLRVPQGRVRLPRQGTRRSRPGGSARLKIKRLNIAERLYRVTGAGIYRDSRARRPAGRRSREPVLNGQVLGSDSVVNAVYRGKIHWFWGDTNRPGYPLGNFHVPGATSRLPGRRRPRPGARRRPRLLRRTTTASPGRPPRCRASGPTWIDGLVVAAATRTGRERMFAGYVKIRAAAGDLRARAGRVRRRHATVREGRHVPAGRARSIPAGIRSSRRSTASTYVYFARPYPLVRVKADPEALADPTQYEAFTCLPRAAGSTSPKVDRGRRRPAPLRLEDATPRPSARPSRPSSSSAGDLKPEEALLHLRDVETGKAGHGPRRLGRTGTTTASAG